MKDTAKTKKQLIGELQALRAEISALKKAKEPQTVPTSPDVTKSAPRQRDREISSITDNVPEIVARFDRKLRHVYVNHHVESATGLSVQEFLGKTNSELNMPDRLVSYWDKSLRKVFKTGECCTIEFSFPTPHGTAHFESRLIPEKSSDGTVETVLVISHDITEHKKAEEDINFQASLLDAVGQGIIATTLDGTICYWNSSAETLYGWKRSEVMGKGVFGITVPQSAQEDAEAIMTELRSGKAWSGEFSVRRKNGTTFPVFVTLSPIYNKECELIGMVGVSKDISEERKNQQALRDSEKRFRDLFEKSPEAIFVHDIEGNLLDVNPAACRLHKMDYETLIKKNVRELVPPEVREDAFKYLQELFKEGTGYSQGLSRASDGTDTPVEIKVNRFRYSGKPALLFHVHDLSDRVRLQEQLLQAQKIDAVGRLAGGIAHDFNNLLTVILGNVEFALRETGPRNRLYKELKKIQTAATQARDLTSQLLTFSKSQVSSPKLSHLNHIIRDQLKMLRRVIGEDITLKTWLAGNLSPVYVDPAQIQQVLMNMCINARDAMPKGGTLKIKSKNVHISQSVEPAEMSDSKNTVPREYVELTIADSGVGMDEETQAQIFEPFFSTKELGKGTGLGLSVVYGIVKQHNGHIDVESELGSGTTFKIMFPAVSESTAMKTEATKSASPRGGGQETILLVEDNRAVLNVGKRILSALGYTVLCAKDGKEAQNTFKGQPEKVNLVILDVVMPGISGPETYKRLSAIRPNVPVIFVTGYDVYAEIGQLDVLESTAFSVLQKPYTKDTLGNKVREVLDEASNLT